MQRLAELLAEQKGRHQGGSKWIGTAGTSPFGAFGYNPEGVRIGQHESRHRRAVKVWEKREFRDLDDTVELGTRNLKLALRRLRQLRAAGRGDRTRSAGHDPLDREECRHAGPEDGAGAAQHGEGAAVPRCRRLDGRLRQVIRRTVLRRTLRVQASGILLLPQLPLRAGVEEQPPPSRRTHLHIRGDAHLRPRLQADLRRRRGDEPVRDHHARRQRRAHERRTRTRLAGAPDVALSSLRLAQPDAARTAGSTCAPSA